MPGQRCAHNMAARERSAAGLPFTVRSNESQATSVSRSRASLAPQLRDRDAIKLRQLAGDCEPG